LLAGAGLAGHGFLYGDLGWDDRLCCLAADRGRSGVAGRWCPVGDECLSAVFWWPAAARRPLCRSFGAAQGFHGRRRLVRLLVAFVWARLVPGGTDRGARCPGCLRGD